MAGNSFSPRRSAIIVALAAILACMLVWQAAVPIRQKVSERYVERGDGYFVALNFDQAASEYNKSLAYNASNETAQKHLNLVQNAAVDIASAKPFFVEHHVKVVLDKLARAQNPYTNPKQALEAGVSFYVAHDFSYAQYPLERAVQLDPEYPEAWHYLALTYQELAKEDTHYKTKAEQALKKQNMLTPKYLNL